MTVDVGQAIKGERKLDPWHYNAFDLIPRIVNILFAKANNKPMSSMIGDSTNGKPLSTSSAGSDMLQSHTIRMLYMVQSQPTCLR
jgi:hypothetical protein